MSQSKTDNLNKFNPIPKLPKMLALSGAAALLQTYQPQLEYVVSYDGFKIPVTVVGNKPTHIASIDSLSNDIKSKSKSKHTTTTSKPPPKPVLLLHAFGMDARQFLPFVLPLASQFCFYLPHFRGFGLAADTPTSEFDFIEQYADDLEVLLTHICAEHETEAVDVAAISMGALVVWAHFNRYAGADGNDSQTHHNSQTQPRTKRQHKIRRYLNIDQSPIVHNQPDWQGGVFGDKQDDIFAQFREVLEATQPYLNELDFNKFSHLPFDIKCRVTDMETAFSLMSVDRLPSRWFINTSGYLPAHKLSIYHHSTWMQKLKGLHAYLELPYDYRHALAQTQIPVTMLVGGKSTLYDPKWQRKVADILPHAKVIEIAESGHAIPMDAPIRFARLLKQFLTE